MARYCRNRNGCSLFVSSRCGRRFVTTNSPDGVKRPEHSVSGFGEDVLLLAKTVKIEPPMEGVLLSPHAKNSSFAALSMLQTHKSKAFRESLLPDLIAFFEKEYKDGVRPTITIAILDNAIGFVWSFGELFASDAMTLRRRARLQHVLVMGYCNDYYPPSHHSGRRGRRVMAPFPPWQ